MPILPIRQFRVTKNEPLAEESFLLGLEPADNEPMFPFVAGQWVMAYLDCPNGGKPWRGAFSIASAPSESGTSFELAIKTSGDLTKRLQALKSGETVRVHGPFGVFTLRPGTDRLVMFAAGIGITPLRSMIREMVAMNDDRDIVLVYSNRGLNGISFEAEFRSLVDIHLSFYVHFLLTGPVPDGWDGEVGRIDEEKMKRLLPSVDNTEFLMCGSKEFMETVAALLSARGVDVRTKLRKELFN